MFRYPMDLTKGREGREGRKEGSKEGKKHQNFDRNGLQPSLPHVTLTPTPTWSGLWVLESGPQQLDLPSMFNMCRQRPTRSPTIQNGATWMMERKEGGTARRATMKRPSAPLHIQDALCRGIVQSVISHHKDQHKYASCVTGLVPAGPLGSTRNHLCVSDHPQHRLVARVPILASTVERTANRPAIMGAAAE
ncbi:hypothetical protein E4U21_005200 [Claviceps maximensis]|nr:hypothetical protein E4U21_005200 [Claviceps maximensis]